MLTARPSNFWHTRYDLARDGVPVAVWDSSLWTSGGRFELDGRGYRVRAGTWQTRYEMTDDQGVVVAAAEKVGRKRWTVQAGDRTYSFRRASVWRGDQELMDGDTPVGLIKRTSSWRTDATADLPGLPLPVQIFVLGVVITMWNAAAAAAAA